jgi:branched-chain amino acid transport system ATP-binding protein
VTADAAISGGLAAPALSVRDVVVDFQGLRAIDKANLEVRHGEIVGLIGPNGAGKTTLVNVLTGFQKVDQGSVHMDGVDIGAWKPHIRSRRGLVRTFQNVLPFSGLTALQNVEAGALAAGLEWAAARKSASDLLARLGLAGKEHRKAGTLPFGEERRVGIARALAMRPRYLLMDEPAAGLNDNECTDLMRVVRDIRADLDCGIMLIEHRMPLVFSLCDRIQVLQMGRMIANGTADEIRSDPAVRKAYLGDDEP